METDPPQNNSSEMDVELGFEIQETPRKESPTKSPAKSRSRSPRKPTSRSPVRQSPPLDQTEKLEEVILNPVESEETESQIRHTSPLEPIISPKKSNSKSPEKNNSPQDVFEFLEFPDPKIVPTTKIVIPELTPVNVGLQKENLVLKQRALDLESQIAELMSSLSEVKSNLEYKSKEVEKQVIENSKLKAEISSKDQRLLQTEDKLAQFKKNPSFDPEKQTLANNLLSKQQEILRLSEELDFASKQILDLKEQSRLEREKVIELESVESHNKSILTSVQQEFLQANKSIEWLNDELSKKSTQLSDYRREKGEEISKLQTQLELALQDKSTFEIRSQLGQKRMEELEEKLSQKIEQMRESENERITAEQQFMSEMQSQKKLADLYQSKSQELSKHNQELENLIRELESRIIGNSQDQEATIEELNRTIKSLEEHTRNQELEIENLKSELASINSDLLQQSQAEQIGQLSETAAVASRLQTAGKSITQVYSEYSKSQQELIKEKAEVARLQDCLNQIVAEFEQRAPLIQKTNEEYQKAREQVDNLGLQLAIAVREKNEAVLNYKNLKAAVEVVENEQNLLRKELEDRSRQIQALLREQHLLRGEHPSKIPPEPSVSNQTGAEGIISQRLVVFKNIEELQLQNQSLLRSIRSLSTKMESYEQKKQDDEENAKLEALNESTKMIEELQEQLRREMINSQSFAQERDQWKKVAESRGLGSPSARPSPRRTPEPVMYSNSVPVSPAMKSGEFERINRDLQMEFDHYKKECGKDIKLLKNQLDQKQQECTEMSIQVAKLNNQINYLNERHELVLQSMETKTRELDQLRDRLSVLTGMAARQDAKIDELNISLMNSRQTIENLLNENQQLKVEKEIIKTSENRNGKELRDMIRERNTANDRIRELQHQLEELGRKHEAQLGRLQEKSDEMNRDLQLSRKQLAGVMDDNRTLSAKRDAEVRESQIRIERLSVDYERTKGELVLLKSKEEAAAAKVAELQAKISRLERLSVVFEGRTSTPDISSSDSSKIFESDLAQTRIELEAVKAELLLAKEQVDAYKAISQASEDRLAEMNATYDVYKADMEKQINTLQGQVGLLEEDRRNLEEKLVVVGRDLANMQEKVDSQNEELQSERQLHEKQLQMVKESEEQALRSVAGIKADLEREKEAAQYAQTNYEREVIAHSTSLQQVSNLKQTLQDLKEERDHAVASQRAAIENLTSNQASADRIKQKLETDIRALEHRIEDLVQQNQLLHSQFEQLTLSRNNGGIEGQPEVVAETNSVADLAEVIKFLRREKEIVETKLEIALQESDRSRLQIEHLQKSLDESRLVQEEERRRHADTSSSDRLQEELKEKIEQTNLLRESNITLRNQFETAQTRISLLETKLRETEMELDPLKQKLVELEGEIEARKAESKSLMEDNARWKGRAQQILEKYERIDPVEHENLKSNIKTLANEKELAIQELRKMQGVLQSRQQEKDAQMKILENTISSIKQEKERLLAEKEAQILALQDVEKNEKYASLAKELAEQKEKYSTLVSDANSRLEASFAKLREARRQVKELTQENTSLGDKIKELEGVESNEPEGTEPMEVNPVDIVTEEPPQKDTEPLVTQKSAAQEIQPFQEIAIEVIPTSDAVTIETQKPVEQETVLSSDGSKVIENIPETPSKRDRDTRSPAKEANASPAPKRLRVEQAPEVSVPLKQVDKQAKNPEGQGAGMKLDHKEEMKLDPKEQQPVISPPKQISVMNTQTQETAIASAPVKNSPISTKATTVAAAPSQTPPDEQKKVPPQDKETPKPLVPVTPPAPQTTPQPIKSTPTVDPAEEAKQKRAMLLKQKLLAEQAKKDKPSVDQKPAPSKESGDQKRVVRAFGRGKGAQIKVKNPQGQGKAGKLPNQ